MADTLTPVGAFRAMVGDAPGFLLESVEHGERWSRFSFVGRSPGGDTGGARSPRRGDPGFAAGLGALDEGVLGCVESLLERFRSPSLDELPPLHGGLVGYLGYDVVREIERLGEPPPDDLGHPDAVVSVIGELAAFDHWRQRVTLVDNVLLDEEKGEGTDAELLEAAYHRRHANACEALRQRPRAARATTSSCRRRRSAATLPEGAVRRGTTAARYRQAVEVAKEYIRAGDAFQIVLSQRFDLDLGCDPFDVYRVLRQVNPSPYMFFLRQGGVSVVGASPEPMVQLLGGPRRVAPDRRHPPARLHRRGGPEARGRARRAPEGASRARHARRPRPQRRRQGGAASAPSGSTS